MHVSKQNYTLLIFRISKSINFESRRKIILQACVIDLTALLGQPTGKTMLFAA